MGVVCGVSGFAVPRRSGAHRECVLLRCPLSSVLPSLPSRLHWLCCAQAKLLAMLKHPNILMFHDAFLEDQVRTADTETHPHRWHFTARPMLPEAPAVTASAFYYYYFQ